MDSSIKTTLSISPPPTMYYVYYVDQNWTMYLYTKFDCKIQKPYLEKREHSYFVSYLREIVCPIHRVMHLLPLMLLLIKLRPTNVIKVAYISTSHMFIHSLSSTAVRFVPLNKDYLVTFFMRSHKTHSTRDRSIPRSLQRKVSFDEILDLTAS